MTAATQGLDPAIPHGGVVELGGRQAATQLDGALVEQAAEPQGRGLLQTRKAVLLGREPGELRRTDHPTGEGGEKKLTDRPGLCNGLLRFCLIFGPAADLGTQPRGPAALRTVLGRVDWSDPRLTSGLGPRGPALQHQPIQPSEQQGTE